MVSDLATITFQSMNIPTTVPRLLWPSTTAHLMVLSDAVYTAPMFATLMEVKPDDSYGSNAETYLVTGPALQVPHTIKYTKGTIYRGHHTLNNAVTTWACNLGHGSGDVYKDRSAWYSAATGPPYAQITLPAREPKHSCRVAQHQVIVYVPAGFDKVWENSPASDIQYEIEHGGVEEVSLLLSQHSDDLTSASCPIMQSTATSSSNSSASRTTATFTTSGDPTPAKRTSSGGSSTPTSTSPSKASSDQPSLLNVMLLSCIVGGILTGL